MRFSLERVSDPAIEPVTLAEIRKHVREYDDTTANDAELNGLVASARLWVERRAGVALVEQSWKLTIEGYRLGYFGPEILNGYQGPYFGSTYGAEWGARWRRGEIYLHKWPVIAITGFASVDHTSGVATEIDSANYDVREKDSKWPRLVPLNGVTWPQGDLRITYRAGFAAGIGSPDPSPDLADVPRIYKQAIMLWAEAHYDRDEKMMPILIKAAENILGLESSELSMA